MVRAFFAPVSIWALLLAGSLHHVMTAARDTWVSQDIERSDAMGAIISKVAGCSPAAIVASMQRSHLRAMLDRQNSHAALASDMFSCTKTELAVLQSLPPDIQLPALILSKQL